jgi:hypothetical protein
LLAALHVGEDVVERWIRGDDGVLEEIETRKGAGGDSAGEGKDGCGSKLDLVVRLRNFALSMASTSNLLIGQYAITMPYQEC